MRDSSPRPLRCHRSALPPELIVLSCPLPPGMTRRRALQGCGLWSKSSGYRSVHRRGVEPLTDAGCKPTALTTELTMQKEAGYFAARRRLLASLPSVSKTRTVGRFLAGPRGFEPPFSCVTGRRVRPLRYGPKRDIEGSNPDQQGWSLLCCHYT